MRVEPHYRIRSVRKSDLPVLGDWLSQPHVTRWYDDSKPKAEELRDPRISIRIATFEGRPFAFVQDYDVHGWSSHHFDFLPPGSRGLDMYIGDPEMIGHGHGPKLLRQHADALLQSGAPALGIDPHPANLAAIRAYVKAGFTIVSGPKETPWGRVILLTREARQSVVRLPPCIV